MWVRFSETSGLREKSFWKEGTRIAVDLLVEGHASARKDHVIKGFPSGYIDIP